MASLFIGDSGTGLRQQYCEALYSDIGGTSGAANALLLCTFRSAARLCFLFNGTGYDLSLWLCHPSQDSTVAANRLFWMEFPANYNLNYDSGSVNWEFDPGTKLYVSKAGGSASAGKFRVISWG